MENILSAEIIDNQQLRPFGYIYITTNLINGKKYIGKHKSDKFDETYKGSGKILRKAIKKYGWDNFKTEVLKWCFSENELNLEEKQIINELKCCESDEYYNLMEGGHGGDNKSYLSQEEYKSYCKKISDSKRNRERTVKEIEQLKNLHQKNIGTHHSEDSKLKSRISNLGQKRSEEAKKHMSENHADFNGTNNPFYGKKHSDDARLKISKNNAKAHLGKVWITNKVDIEILIPQTELKNYPEYVRGRLRKRQKVKFND